MKLHRTARLRAIGLNKSSCLWRDNQVMRIERKRFEELVSEAIDEIPESLAKHMQNIAVFVELWPRPDQHPHRRGLLLGRYDGVDLTRRGPMSYEGAMPDRITLFQEPICRISQTEDDLKRNVVTTLVHEVGHHFGIGDRRLHELGY